MANGTETRSCTTKCWINAVIVGVILAVMLMLLGDWRFIQAAFAGVIGAIIVGFLLTFFMCSEDTAKSDLGQSGNSNKGMGAGAATATVAAAGAATAASAASSAASTASSAGSTAAEAVSDEAPEAVSDVAPEPVSDAASASAGVSDAGAGAATAAAASAAGAAATTSKPFEMKPSKPLAGEAELAERKGDWKYEGEAPKAKKAPAKKPAAKAAPAKKAAAKAAPAKKATKAAPAKKAPAKAAPAKAAAAKPKRAPVAADGKPETLKKARAGGADDLKLISGVGPKMEGMLNDLGFWHFDQVAGWRKKEVQWVNDNLEGFKGRIERDDWVSQAKILAKGGATEFSKRKTK